MSPKNPLTHAVNTILKPEFEKYGFVTVGSRRFVRRIEGIVQYISIVKSGRSSYFEIVCSTIPLFTPLNDFHISYSRKLPRDGRENGRWSSKHIDVAESAAFKVIAEFRNNLFPEWFDETKTIEGTIKHLKNYMHQGFHAPHLSLSACFVAMGEEEKALEVIGNALSLETYNPVQLESLNVLFGAIKNNDAQDLIERWQSDSVKALKLDSAM